MVRSELEKVHLSNGGRSRTAAACSGVEFRNGSQLLMKFSRTFVCSSNVNAPICGSIFAVSVNEFSVLASGGWEVRELCSARNTSRLL